MEAALRDFEYIPLSSWSYEISPDISSPNLNHTQPSVNSNQPSTSSQSLSNKESKIYESKKAYYMLQRKKHKKSRLFSEESNRDKRVRELNR
jgi:hypothetical protein